MHRKASKMSQHVAKPAVTIANNLAMAVVAAADTVADEIVESDKCSQRFVPHAEPKPRFLLNQIRQNQFTAATVLKNLEMVELYKN
jgi:hypothetical protein